MRIIIESIDVGREIDLSAVALKLMEFYLPSSTARGLPVAKVKFKVSEPAEFTGETPSGAKVKKKKKYTFKRMGPRGKKVETVNA